MNFTLNLISKWMDNNNVTNVELAEKMNVSESLVRAILKGERKLTAKRLDSLATIMTITVEELLGMEKNEFAGYSVMLRGGSEELSRRQEKIIMDVAMLANDYEKLKKFIQ